MTDNQCSPDSSEALANILMRCRTVLGNMADENEGAIFNRWPINHEPLRADAKNLVPLIDEALRNHHETFMATRCSADIASLAEIFKHADEADWKYIDQLLMSSIRHSQDQQTKFWRSALTELRNVLRSPHDAQPEPERLPTYGNLLAEINQAAHAAGTNAWVRDVLKRAHRAIRLNAPLASSPPSTEGK